MLDRRFIAPAVAVLLAGCPSPPAEPACGDLAAFDLSGCDVSTLGQVFLGGIYNANLTWLSGAHSNSALYTVVQGGEQIDGRPASSKAVNSYSLYFATSYTEGGHEKRLAFAGCEAQGNFHVIGGVQSCVDGVKVDEGAFEAQWVDWAVNESQSVNVALVSETPLAEGAPADVWVEGGFAYVAAHAGGVAVFDVRAPAAPALVATVQETGDDFGDAKVLGTTLYIASQKHGVLLYDVSNPAAPVRLGQVPADDVVVTALEVDATAHRLFASAPAPNGEELVFDAQTPSAPVLSWRVRAMGADVAAGRWPHDVSFLGDRMFVNHGTQGLVAFDLPPAQRASFGGLAAGVASHSSQAADVGGRTMVFEAGEGWGSELRVVDYTDPDAPALVGEWSNQHPEVSMRHVALAGTKVYVAHYQAGLRIIDVSNPAAPVQSGYFNTWRPFDVGRGKSFYDSAVGVRVPGDGNIYLAETQRGLMIFGETGP